MQGTLAAIGMMTTSALSGRENAETAAASETALLRDDFSKLPVGRLTHPLEVQSTAIQENQWIDPRVHEFGL